MNQKEIYLIRHGETEWNKLKKIQGQEADIPLCDCGRNQAKKTGLYLRDFRIKSKPFDRIISSPLERAKETAEIIGNIVDYKKDIEYDNVLMERIHGKISGLSHGDELMIQVREFKESLFGIMDPIDRYNKADSIIDMINDKFDIGMENDGQLGKRVETIIQKLTNSKCEKIIVIGHWGSLMCLIKTMFALPQIPEGDFKNGSNCWICYIEYNNIDGFRMQSPPNTEHFNLINEM